MLDLCAFISVFLFGWFLFHLSFRHFGNKGAQVDEESMLPPSGMQYYNQDLLSELEFLHLCRNPSLDGTHPLALSFKQNEQSKIFTLPHIQNSLDFE